MPDFASKIGALPLMQGLFQRVLITPEVAKEIRFAVPSWIDVVPVANQQHQKTLELTLDVGEASSIALYFEQPGALLVIDERKGRAPEPEFLRNPEAAGRSQTTGLDSLRP